VLTMAGVDALAVLPAAANDPLVSALQSAAVPYRVVPTDEPARTNLTITEHDGTTTKINEPGATLNESALRAFTDAVLDAADGAA
ncbi:1-phosphofructokinase, partial [Mycobacterium sp. ITM-2017-0098]